MVTRAILVKPMQNEQLETLTLAVFEVQRGNVPFWKWQKNRVQMVQTIFESIEKSRFYVSLACNYTHFSKIALVTIYMLQSLKTGSHFFHKEPNYLLKMFLWHG